MDSALHAPQAAFGGRELHTEFADEAAVLVVRIVGKHPLPDGNERLGWTALVMFCELNGYRLEVPVDDAVERMFAIAEGKAGEPAVAAWLEQHLQRPRR